MTSPPSPHARKEWTEFHYRVTSSKSDVLEKVYERRYRILIGENMVICIMWLPLMVARLPTYPFMGSN